MAKAKTQRNGESGVALIEHVIAVVEKKGLSILDVPGLATPEPMSAAAIAKLRFGGGEKPSPSLRRWLAFDASWVTALGWLSKKGPGVERSRKEGFAPKTIAEFAEEEYGAGVGGAGGFGLFADVLPGALYLLPGGSDSRRAMYVGIADSAGEHPVLLLDNDDLPRVALLFPGFDVFMADLVGLDLGSAPIAENPLFATRMVEHTHRNMGGKAERDLADLHQGDDPRAPRPYRSGDDVPDGFEVAVNPFTKHTVLVRK